MKVHDYFASIPILEAIRDEFSPGLFIYIEGFILIISSLNEALAAEDLWIASLLLFPSISFPIPKS